eukprot:6477804-Pyramimonas_sp.AAC.2
MNRQCCTVQKKQSQYSHSTVTYLGAHDLCAARHGHEAGGNAAQLTHRGARVEGAHKHHYCVRVLQQLTHAHVRAAHLALRAAPQRHAPLSHAFSWRVHCMYL